MSQHDFRIQINTLTDRANFVLHGVAYGATCIGIGYFVGSPTITTVSLIGSVLINSPFSNKINLWLRESFPATPIADLPGESKKLPVVIAHLSKALGVRSPPPLYAFDEAPVDLPSQNIKQPPSGDKSDSDKVDSRIMLRKTLGKIFGKFANAAAYGTDLHGVLISRPLMRILNTEEETAVIAHEMGHIAANHMKKKRMLGVPKTTAALNAASNMVLTLFGSWYGFGAFVASMVALSATSSLLVKKFGFDLKNEKQKAVIMKLSGLASAGTLLGVAYLAGKPEIIGAWVAAKASATTVKLVDAHYSRCNEFQADRIAAEVTRDPLSLISGLRKAQAYNLQVRPEIAESDYTKGPFKLRLYRRAKAVFWTHPHTDRRAARLMKMARNFAGPQTTASLS